MSVVPWWALAPFVVAALFLYYQSYRRRMLRKGV
jgi:hypothetical protein